MQGRCALNILLVAVAVVALLATTGPAVWLHSVRAANQQRTAAAHWPQVPINVTDVQPDIRERCSTTDGEETCWTDSDVTASYTYQWQGRKHTSDRVAYTERTHGCIEMFPVLNASLTNSNIVVEATKIPDSSAEVVIAWPEEQRVMPPILALATLCLLFVMYTALACCCMRAAQVVVKWQPNAASDGGGETQLQSGATQGTAVGQVSHPPPEQAV